MKQILEKIRDELLEDGNSDAKISKVSNMVMDMIDELPSKYQSVYSIGFFREYGDFQILMTLNNNDGLIREETMRRALTEIPELFSEETGNDVIVKNRQDVPDYVEIME